MKDSFFISALLMKAKRLLALFILFWYLASNLLSYLGYINRNTVFADSNNKNTSTQLVAILVDDQIYPSIESDLKRYTTQYLQKNYPLSKALVLKINTKEYSAPELTKLLENMYFDGLKDQSSRMIGVVLVWEIPLPVVRYQDYIFPSIYPYVDFLEQKYLWDEESKYFVKNNDNGQAELWHGMINFNTIEEYHTFFNKLKQYDNNPTDFVDKKIWYDDFIALKKNFLEDAYKFYQNSLIFAEDSMYHRYTNFFAHILQKDQDWNNQELISDLSKELKDFWITNSSLELSKQGIQEEKSDYTPTKLLEKKIQTFFRKYYEVLSNPLLNTISENIKASDRREQSDSHYKKLHIKDQVLLGDNKTNWILKSINDRLEAFVDQKVEKENYAMKTAIPIYYQQSKDKKRKILFKKYYIPEFNDIYQFFYFWRNAQTIKNAQDFSLFRWTYRNLSWFVAYSQIIWDSINPAKTKEDKTELNHKGLGSSYDLFSTQVEANRGYNIFNTESEYELYQKEKKHAKINRHCSKRLFGLKWKWLPCVKSKWEPIGKCKPESDNQKDQADCENFQQFGNRVWWWATPLNIDTEKMQNQIYNFSGAYDPKSAWKEIYDIAGSVRVKNPEIDALSFKSAFSYASPTKTARKEWELKDATDHSLKLDQVRYFNVPLKDKVFKPESSSVFSLKKEKKHRQDLGLLYKYKIIPSKVKHDATTATQINGYSGLKYSEDTEYWGYYTSIKEGLTLPQDTYSEPLLQKLNIINRQLSSLKNHLQAASNETNPQTIKNLISPSLLKSLVEISSWQAEIRSNYNTLITKNYASDTKSTIEWIILRQINQKGRIWLLQTWYNEIINKISVVQTFITKQQQVWDLIFTSFLNSVNAVEVIKKTIDTWIITHQWIGTQDKEIRLAWESLYTPLNQLSWVLAQINQSEPCNANHSILGTMLWKDENQISFWDERDPHCLWSEEAGESSSESWNTKNPLQTIIDDVDEAKSLFTTHFFSDTDNPQVEIPWMNILTPERPIDSPRYLSFQGVGENEVKLIYPNLFKTEIYNQSFVLKSPDSIRQALIDYLNNKVIEYNTILSEEKQKAKKLNEHYLKLFSVDKLATPSLETSVRSYQPFTYEEMLDAIGGEKMLNSLAELLYYQNISNQIKTYNDNIQEDIQNTKKNFDINEKIDYILQNYLTQEKDNYYQRKNTHSKFIIPTYTTKGYEVGYINSDSDDTIIPDQDEQFNEWVKKIQIPQEPKREESPSDAKEAHDIEKECWFNINEGLLLYNFKSWKFDWREGLKCRLKTIKKKPFEISLSFEGSLWAVPIKETVENDVITPLSDSRDTYKKSLKSSIGFDNLIPTQNSSENSFVQQILNQTQITTQNKKISVLNKTGAFNLLSLKDYGNLTVKITSTGDNCLIVDWKNTCISKATITKNPFKNGFGIDFLLAENKIWTIIATLELCWWNWTCGTKSISLSAVPGDVKSFEIWLPEDRKLLAGAYTLISLKALDLYKNEIQRTLEPYIIEVDKWKLIVWGQEKKSQEVNDFQNLTLLYRWDLNSNWIVKFSVKNKKWELLSSNTANLISWKLSLEQNWSPIQSFNYQITDLPYFSSDSKGNMILNNRKVLALDVILRDTTNTIVPITTNIILGSKNNLAKVMSLQEAFDGKWKKKLTLTPVSSILMKNGKVRIYLVPWYISWKDLISLVIPGLKEQVLSLDIAPWDLEKITFNLEKEKLDPNSSSTAIISLTDAWWNKINWSQKVFLWKNGPMNVSPYGMMNIVNGEQKLQLKSNQQGWRTQIYAEAESNGKKVEWSTNIITKKFFLNSSIASGVNIMYLNLFGNDWWNQRGYQSDNRKVSETIISKSKKTLAVTTQLVDLNKIKRTSLIFWKNWSIENIDQHPLIARKENGKLLLQIEGIWTLTVNDLWIKRKIFPTQSLNEQKLLQENEKSLYIYDIDQNFSYTNGSFKNQEGIKIASLDDGITFQWTDEQIAGEPIWNIIGKGQILGKAIFTGIDFSNTTADLENKEYEFWSVFSNGSTTSTVKAVFSTLDRLKTDYQGYDSIQNSDEMEKAIWFRGNFKNITSFAGGQSVGEATLAFGSEFLINIWDPALKRIDQNKNLEKADYNQGLWKVVYNDIEKPIFKTLDIDYNNDGLRDLLIIYKDWEIRLQKQYQDKKFKTIGTLMMSAEPIKEVFIGDIDGNKFEDIVVHNTKNQIRIYTNQNGIFDVDGKIACLNTNTKPWEITITPENLSKVHQLFVKDMDADGKIDIITLDKKWYLKIFYGKGNLKNHSYLSKNIYNCDNDRSSRQESSTKIVKKFWLQLNWESIRDESLIRRDGLNYPTENELQEALNQKNNREKWIETDPILLGKIENEKWVAPCQALDYSCSRNSYWEQFCKKYRKYNTCKACSIPTPNWALCWSNEYREMYRQTDDQRIRGKLSYEDGMCRLPSVPTCIKDGDEENGRIDANSKSEIIHAGQSLNFVDTAKEGVWVFDKYIKNPFENLEWFAGQENWAFVPINKLETPLPNKILSDKVRDISKRYTDINWWNLEEWDKVKVEVLIINKNGTFGSGGAFFDKIQGPRLIEQNETTQAPKDIQFQEGIADINPKTDVYAYYLTNMQFSANNQIVYTYTLTYHMDDPLFKIRIENINPSDYKISWVAGVDTLPDIIIQSAKDWCNKQQSLLINKNEIFKKKRTYEEKVVNLQKLSDNFMDEIDRSKKQATQEIENKVKETKNINTLNNMPGINEIQETFSVKDILSWARSDLKKGEKFDLGNINVELFDEELTNIEHTIQDAADKMCNGFSLSFSNLKSCEGLPVPFNQAFLAPGNYHLMGCIPLEPLTRTLGKGLPVFHFPGTLYTPVWSIPIPWGLKWPGDGFLWAWWGVYPSQIRIYAAPTLTAQLWLAICMWPYSAGISMPSPLSDIGGNCIVTSMPLPCGKKKSWTTNDTTSHKEGTTYHPWAEDYRQTNTCQLKQSDSPFKITASALTNDAIPSSLAEGSYLGWTINIDYDAITSQLNVTQNGLEINGIKIDGVKDIKNAILWGKQQGLQKKLVWRFDRQTQYWINNLLRFRVEVIFPDMDHLSKQISSFNFQEIWKLTSEWTNETETTLSELNSKFKKSENLKTLAKNTLTKIHSKENLTALDLANWDNPFEKLQTFFNNKELVNISSQTLNIKVPRIYSEDIEAYKGYLLTWKETNKETLKGWNAIIDLSLWNCKKELSTLSDGDLEKKKAECKVIEQAKTQILQMISKFDKTSEQIYQNIQVLELYKRFPLQIYEWLHVSDKYLWEISALLSNFFWYINYWMEVNANRFTQYVDAIITILGVVKTYQVIVDLFVDRGKKCGKCTNDTYDQYSCKLSFLCPDLPIIPIPSVKIPSLYIDLSHLNLGMDIVLPRFNFVPESVELPRLPNLPEPPQLGINFKIDFNIPDIPLLPEPPELPELPSFIPQVKMQLPVLPPAPKIPELPNQITAMVSIAKKLSKIYCIIKSWIGLVGESSVKARIEQMTQRTYNVPRVDNLDLTAYFRQTPLQWVDIQVDSYVNLQYNFDAFYALLKGMVDTINQGTYNLTSQAESLSNNVNDFSDKTTDKLNTTTETPINLNVQVGYKDKLKWNLTSLQDALSSDYEKKKIDPLLSLAWTDTTVSANTTGLLNMKNQVSWLLKDEQKEISTLAQLAKSDYTKFLKTIEKWTKNKPVQLSFSTHLLKDNTEAKKTIINRNPTEELISTEAKRLNGYMLALNTHSASELNMSDKTYKNSKNYLQAIQSKLNQWNSIKTHSYAGEQTLLTKNGDAEQRTLLTQIWNKKPATHETSTTDMSSYIEGVLVKNHENNLVNVVHSKLNYEKFPKYYQQDLNNDKKAELITRDDHNVYIKYANDVEPKIGQKFKDFYVITPQLKNKEKKYESFWGWWLWGKSDEIKLYDQNSEVKNFKLEGQTFDSLSFSWINNHHEAVSGYLMQISEKVDGLVEKYDQKWTKYLLFLPKGTEINTLKLQIEGSTFKVKNQIWKLISEVFYYNPAEEKLQFSLHEAPRKWQYLQLTSLRNENRVYQKNAPRSNQIVAGRQVIWDNQPPTAKVKLIRKRKSAIEDEGLDLQWYIWSYYDLEITRTDDTLITTAYIQENKKQIMKKAINASEGTLTLKDLFFTKEQTKHYTVSAKDSEGNEKIESISLNIKIPEITIENIQQVSGWKEGIENPILITSELEKDIDQGNVSFEKQRNSINSPLIATQNGKKIQTYPVSTNQTTITGAYYDFGELIGLYTENKKLIATVNGQNGEIKIQPAFQKTTNLKVSFSKGYPIVNVIQNWKILFEIILQSEALINKDISQGTLYALEGQNYGSFNGWEVILKNKEPLLYIAKNGSLRSNKPLRWSYQFNSKEKTVSYSLSENAFGESFAAITFKVKPL